MDIITKLDQWGCDTKNGLRRLLGDRECYIECVLESLSELCNIKDMEEAVKSNNPKKAFDIAHYHKGSLANLGLTPLLIPISELTEMFRKGKIEGAETYIKVVKERIAELAKICDK